MTEQIGLGVGPEAAWEFLTRWEVQASWMKDAAWVHVLGAQREGVGTKIEVKTLLYGIPAFVEPMEVIGWEQPSRLLLRHGGVVKGTGEWILDPIEVGCRFTWTEDARLELPLVGGLAASIYSGFLRKLMRRSMATLQDQLS